MKLNSNPEPDIKNTGERMGSDVLVIGCVSLA